MRLPPIIAALLLLLLVAVGVGAFVYVRLHPPSVASRTTLPAASSSGNGTSLSRAAGAVVRVETSAPASPSPGAVASETQGGSGVVVDSAGYVLTAEAVVAGAPTIVVALPGVGLKDARVIGSDPDLGVTLLRVDATNLKTVDIAGDAAMTPGSGFVLLAAPPASAALADVSAAGVSAPLDDPAHPGQQRVLNDLVSLDVIQRQGELGAALLDGSGRVTGLVVAQRDGVGTWAASASSFRDDIRQLIGTGHLSYHWLTFDYQQLSPSEAADRGVGAGVLVLSVPPGPAADAGLAVGDVVLALNGTSLDSGHPLRQLVAAVPVNQDVSLTVHPQSGANRTISVLVTLLTP